MAWLQLQALRSHICRSCITYERWDKETRRAAKSVIRNLAKLHRENRLLSIWLSTISSPAQQFTPSSQVSDENASSFGTCHYLLTAFAETWPPAALYRDVIARLSPTMTEK
ncbi:uncharacterized protein PV07_01949 [Cladophialophora immunda]|uniref:Uncharacterized protein n=1 Tax=Cladophialophora immunda TaxID=569365 RepID=A0A0D2CVW8_9EURO|nr:uncharacterized protein PV07_01949 [Cladophialophora immunda]KIW35243.1 hypothetical protein PV07_01949 [Cladophialophora immunda]